jgi:SNF2 family DNA or RNA helicase
LEFQPELVQGSLREYQLVGASFMAQMAADGVGCILADEMGLGKTMQSIALIARLKLELKQPGACLVVVPLSVMSSWMNEFKRWCPTLKVARAHSR